MCNSPRCGRIFCCAAALLCLVVLLSSSVSAQWKDPLYIVFPRIKTDAVSTTAVAIANPTDDDAEVLLGFVDNKGTVVDAVSGTIPAHTQLARQVSELFPTISTFDGFLILQSTNISVVGFFLTYNSDLANHQIDGAEAVVVASGLPGRLIFPEIVSGTGGFAEISLFTIPGDSPLNVTLKLYGGGGGSPLQTKVISIPAGELGGRFTGRVDQIFTGTIPSPAYVTATTDPARNLGLVGYEHFGNSKSFGGRNAIGAPLSAQNIQFSLFGAQLAEGWGYSSEITLINPTDQPATVKFSAYRTGAPSSAGAPTPAAARTRTIPANGMIKERARTLIGLPSGDFLGWLRVDSDIAGVVGDITFGDANATPPRFMSSVQLQSMPVSDFVFSHLATDPSIGFATGLTFLNINPDPAPVLVEVYDVNGNLTGRSNGFELQPFEHAPRSLGDIPGLQNIKPQIGGFVRVISDEDIFSFELFLYAPAPAGQVLSLSAVPPQRGNGTMSGELTPALVGGSAALASALKASRQMPYPASAAKGIQLNDELDFVPGEMIVQFKDSAPPDALEQVANRHGSRIKVKSPAGVHLLASRAVESGISLLRSGAGAQELATAKNATLQAIEALNREPDVLYAEPNYLNRICGVPNDPFYSYQWHYPYINLPAAWDITTGSTDTVIAVIDTGAKFNHPDFDGRVVAADCYDFITDPQISLDGDGPDADADDVGDDPNKQTSTYHGSHVAGTIGAKSDNGTGVAGVNWRSPLMILRCLGAGGGTDYDISQAILYAAGLSNGTNKKPSKAARVINMSLSSDGDSTTERNAVRAAINAGVTIVAAAGNQDSSSPRYPAAYPGVIAVGAIDPSGGRAPYSNYGSHLSVVAPGGNTAMDSNDDGYVDGVLSIGWKQETDAASYPFKQGTSMAAPHVAGIASLLLAKKPGLTPAQIKQVLEETAIDIGAAGRDDYYGSGLVDPVAALKHPLVSAPVSSTPKLVVSTTSLDFGYTETEMTATVSNGGGGTLNVEPPKVTQGSNWLTATGAGNVMTVKVNRAGLANGSYSGEIQLTSNGGNAKVTVVMKVGTPSVGNLGTILVLALDPRTLESVGTIRSTDPRNLITDNDKDGTFEFQFPPVFAGYYFVIAGNNPDNDEWICEDGEYCGLYPVSSQLSLVQILPNENTFGIDFVLEKTTAPAGLSLLDELKLRTGQRGFRIPENVLSTDQLDRIFRQKLAEAGK